MLDKSYDTYLSLLMKTIQLFQCLECQSAMSTQPEFRQGLGAQFWNKCIWGDWKWFKKNVACRDAKKISATLTEKNQ